MKRAVSSISLIVLALYLLVNCTLIAFVPLLHHVKLDFTVLDENSGEPVRAVELAWLWTNPSTGFQWTERIGVTDENGQLGIEITVQEQPLWCYPPIGSFGFHNHTLQLSKVGYEKRIIALADACGRVPYGRTTDSVKLTMTSAKLQ